MTRLKVPPSQFWQLLSRGWIQAYAYVLGSVIIVAGIWSKGMLGIAIICYVYSRWEQKRRPKFIILRSFGTPRAEVFLQRAIGGLGLFIRPIWLYDATSKFEPRRKHLPGLWLYVSRLVVWILLGWFILGRVKGNLPYEILWISWMVVASGLYHRYKAGQSPTRWIAAVLSVLLTLCLRPAMRVYLPATYEDPWLDALAITGSFLALWILFIVVLRTTPLKLLFGWMSKKRVIENADEVEQYVKELRGSILLQRYLPTAPIGTVELICNDDTWGVVVYESLAHCCLVVADVSDLDLKSSLAWELEQVRLAGVPAILTCEEMSVEKVAVDLPQLGFNQSDLFTWKRDPHITYEVLMDYDAFSEFAISKMKEHFGNSPYLSPIRPSRVEALIRLRKIKDKGMSRKQLM